ncbi:sensor histidine kinase [Cryobacterium zhongshanensis]|uniref:Sensor-like histidine kinase SenX3 n=1 Tax=Cryobacterium zhongshanensis TaxID=2928153 RepID=A0AA41UHM9_9MICO|nr:HAMP domain-containing sensor histidine kinase [Cryobacterium zhongshanensis]MCI4660065.1 HAMP domain-containing histidine kinase [Cryobacterium zhongshanensis]
MIFRQATRRITVAFTGILLLLFGAFALGIYLFVTATFDYDSVASNGVEAVDAAEQGFATLRIALLIGYLLLVLVVPFVSYGMARVVLRPVRHSYNMQQAFVDDASHEFRTPLAIIQGELELAISRRRQTVEYEAAINTALEEVDHLTSLTSDLLLLARGSDDQVKARFQPVSVETVIKRAIERSGAQVRVTIETPAVQHITGAEDLLIRAVGNVLDNAAKFSAPDSTISLTVGTRGDRILIKIVDEGPGMTAETLSHVFDRFWRAEESRNLPGHGLGLALVKQICEAHNGTITIESALGVGTTVRVLLPAS